MRLLKKCKTGNSCTVKFLGIKIKRKKDKYKRVNHTSSAQVLNYFIGSQPHSDLYKNFTRQRFYNHLRYFPDFDNPKSFNEKVYWMKFYYHNPLITTCCDKYAVKDYIRKEIGEGYTVPTIKTWENVNDINFDELPDKFVLKVNWSSGYNIIVKDKSKLNIDETKAALSAWMQPYNNSYYTSFNWGYKNAKPVMYAEEFISELSGDVADYKFMCFNGEPQMILVISNRFGSRKITKTFLDMNWNILPFKRPKVKVDKAVQKPKNFEQMVEIARKLAKPFPFVRVDFYDIGDKPLIGEMTFYPGGGLEIFEPQEWDYKVGDMLKLPEKMLAEGE